MQIQRSEVRMASQVLSTERYDLQESLRVWVGDGDLSTNEAAEEQPLLQIGDRLTLSSSSCAVEEDVCYKERGLTPRGSRHEIIRLLLERLTGRKIRLLNLSDLEPKRGVDAGDQSSHGRPERADASAGFGLAYDRYETYSEAQTLQFVSRGVLLTEDGREVRFELQFAMEHTFSTTEHASIRLGDARMMDPLVVDLDGQGALLTDATFTFDMDSDGVEEKVAALGPGKGFLALDRNGDGRISDGSELFGPRLGDGFLELSGLDMDGNGWIDQKEAAFKDLGVWSKDPQGTERFLSMKESGIGAIYTGRIQTPFSLKGAGNGLLGELKETGLYLHEDGSARALQELNLVV